MQTDQEGLEYVKSQLAQGRTEDEIKKAMLDTGWNEQVVQGIFQNLAVAGVQQAYQGGQLLPVGKLLSNAIDIYKTHWKTLVTLSSLPVVTVIISIIIFGGALGYGSVLGRDNIASLAPGFSLLFLGFIIIAFLIQILSTVAVIIALKERQNNYGVKESLKAAVSKIGQYIWVSILMSLAIGVGFLLLIIPGIILWVWYSFSVFVTVAEDLKGGKALARSKEYVKGRWGKIFGKLAFIYLIVIAFNIIVGLIPENALIDGISTLIGLLILTPIVWVYSYLLYENVRATKR